MALKNLIGVSFSEAELNALDESHDTIQQILGDKVVNLSSEQCQQYGRIAKQNKLIVDKTKNYMERYPQWLPSFVDKAEFDNNYIARQLVETRVQRLENLAQQLLDTKTFSGQGHKYRGSYAPKARSRPIGHRERRPTKAINRDLVNGHKGCLTLTGALAKA